MNTLVYVWVHNTGVMYSLMTLCITALKIGKTFKTSNFVDEYTRECLMIQVQRKLNLMDVIDALSALLILTDISSVHQIR